MKPIVVAAIAQLMAAAAPGAAKAATRPTPRAATAPHAAATPALAPEKTFNLRLNVLSLVFSTISAAGEIGVSSGATVGPEAFYNTAASGTSDVASFGFGLKSVVYFNGRRLADGFYLSPFVDMMLSRFTDPAFTDSATATSFLVGANVGYQWMWRNGFNLNLGVGAQYVSLGDTITFTDSLGNKTTEKSFGLTGVAPSVELAVGYAF